MNTSAEILKSGGSAPTTRASSRFSALMSSSDEDDSNCNVQSAAPASADVESIEKAVESVAIKEVLPSHSNVSAQEGSDDWSVATSSKGQHRSNRSNSVGSGTSGGFMRTSNHHSRGSNHHQGHGGNQQRRHQPQQQVPVAFSELSTELSLEVFNFPSSWRTFDLRRFLNQLRTPYRLKWQGDTSCWVHFESAEKASSSLQMLLVKIKESDDAAVNIMQARPFELCNVDPAYLERLAGDDAAAATSGSSVSEPSLADSSSVFGKNCAVEVYECPPAWRGAEIRALFAAHEGQYRLKWNNDTSCLIIFDKEDIAKEALQKASTVVQSKGNLCKVRLYADV